jgi:hypothetical protein
MEYNRCENLACGDDYYYVRNNYWNAVMGGTRDEIQKTGFRRFHTLRPGVFNEVFVPVNPSEGHGYSSEVLGGIQIYLKRDTMEYDCLLRACNRLAESGPADGKRRVGEFLIETIRARSVMPTGPLFKLFSNALLKKFHLRKVDVAGVIDTIPLLSFFRNEIVYDYLVDFLSVAHQLVLAQVASIFCSVRYRKAASGLLRIVKSERSYATLPALGGLRLNGQQDFFPDIIEACDGKRLTDEDVDGIAHVLMSIDNNQALEFARKNAEIDLSVRRLLAFRILSLNKAS